MNAASVSPDYLTHCEGHGAYSNNHLVGRFSIVSPVSEEDGTSAFLDNYHHRYFDGEENDSSDDDFFFSSIEEAENYCRRHNLMNQGLYWALPAVELTSSVYFDASCCDTLFSMDEDRSDDKQDAEKLEQQFSPFVPWRMPANSDDQSNGDAYPLDGVTRHVQFDSKLDYDGDIEDNDDEESSTGCEKFTDIDFYAESHEDEDEKAAPVVGTNLSGGTLRWLSRLANSSLQEDVLREWSTAACRLDGLPVPPDADSLEDCPMWYEKEEDQLEVTRFLEFLSEYDSLNGHY